MIPAWLVASTVATVVAMPALQAQSSPTFTGNVTLVGDYRFRGVSQTYTQPAIQGGLDYASATGRGAYVGAWGSNVSGNQFLNGGSLELDLYGGYRSALGAVGLDVGAQYYWYPRARYNISPGDRYNTTEVYVGLKYAQFAAKYSLALTNLFGMKTSTVGGYCGIDSDGAPATVNCLGTGSSKGSGYVDLNAAFNVPLDMSLGLHFGRQFVRSYEPLAYSDYKIGLTRAFGPVTLGAAAVGTDAEGRFYRYTPTTAGSQETQDVGKLGIVLSASKAF